jgi:hypothetical protein
MNHPENCTCSKCWNEHLATLTELELEILAALTPNERAQFKDAWKGGIDSR